MDNVRTCFVRRDAGQAAQGTLERSAELPLLTERAPCR